MTKLARGGLLLLALLVAACGAGPGAATATPVSQTLTPCVNQAEPAAQDTLTTLPGTLYMRVKNEVRGLAGTPPKITPAFELTADDYVLDGLSPDGRWFLYGRFVGEGGRPTPLTLRSVEGETVAREAPTEQVAPDGNWVYSVWINNALLLIHRVDMSLDVAYPYVVELYDAAADTWRTDLIAELPNRHSTGAVAVSPDLTRVMYVAAVGEMESLVLWDLAEHKELWRQDDIATQSIVEGTRVGAFPLVWSADSAQVAFLDWGSLANQFEAQTYVLDREGQAAVAITAARPNDFISGMAWSPDGRYLAGVTGVPSNPAQTAVVVYDTVTHTGMDVCTFGARENPLAFVFSGRVVWSPDSRYVAYHVGTADDPNNGIMVQDIFSGQLTLLARGAGASLVGWSGVTK